MTQEVQTLFRSLYFNLFGLQDKYVSFEKVVATRLSGNPYVIGFDPINEPVGVFTNFLGIVDALIPGKWDRQLL
jgi:aryl-phospho-beta-D-glucosidase BglC (GH1 family)